MLNIFCSVSLFLCTIIWDLCIYHVFIYFVSSCKKNVEQTVELPVIWDAMMLMWHQPNECQGSANNLLTQAGIRTAKRDSANWQHGRLLFPLKQLIIIFLTNTDNSFQAIKSFHNHYHAHYILEWWNIYHWNYLAFLVSLYSLTYGYNNTDYSLNNFLIHQ